MNRPTHRPPSLHPCVDCQRRKVKCDRNQPCLNCVRYGVECRQPEAAREPRRPRRAKDSAMLDRIHQLERALDDLRNHLGPAGTALPAPSSGSPRSADASPSTASPEPARPPGKFETSLPDAMGRLYIDDGKERYIAGGSWANLANEVADLRSLFEQRDKPNGMNGAGTDIVTESIFSGDAADAELFAPTLAEKQKLWELYLLHVDPILKIVDTRQWAKVMETHWLNPSQLDNPTRSLIAAMNFASVTSVSEAECERTFGRERDWLLKQTRSIVKRALRAADFLTSQESLTLKAFIIYIICDRRHEEPRTSWIMVGIAFRLAQSIGIHRDGTSINLPPYHVQDRRRTWWLLRMLDAACAEDCGFMPTQIFGEDTKMPMNINDGDLSPEDTEFPPELETFSDMTLPRLRYAINHYMPAIHQHVCNANYVETEEGGEKYLSEASALVEQKSAWIEEHYFRICDDNIPIQRFARQVGKIILHKLFLIAHIPAVRGGVCKSDHTKSLRNKLFVISCEIIEMGHELRTNPETSQWSWLLETYMEWHPVAYLLRALCMKPLHEMRSRGWQAIDSAISRSHGVTIDMRRALWKPLLGLLEKAEAAAKNATRNSSPPVVPDIEREFQVVNIQSQVPADAAAALSSYTDFGFLGLPDIAQNNGSYMYDSQLYAHMLRAPLDQPMGAYAPDIDPAVPAFPPERTDYWVPD